MACTVSPTASTYSYTLHFILQGAKTLYIQHFSNLDSFSLSFVLFLVLNIFSFVLFVLIKKLNVFRDRVQQSMLKNCLFARRELEILVTKINLNHENFGTVSQKDLKQGILKQLLSLSRE